MKRPLILWDWDGTISDSMELCVKENEATSRDLGLKQHSEAEYRACNGPTLEQCAVQLNIPEALRAEYVSLCRRYYMELLKDYAHLFPGTEAMLRRLRQKANLAVVSNGSGAYVNYAVDTFGLKDLFVTVQGFIPGKAKAELIATVLEREQPDRVIMVGDRLSDISAGQANGLETWCVTYGFGTPEEWAAADHQADTVEDLERQLNGWISRG